jgi:hypothetical protein
MIVADPWKDIADGLKIAFYIQSNIVGGTRRTWSRMSPATCSCGLDRRKTSPRVYAVYHDARGCAMS